MDFSNIKTIEEYKIAVSIMQQLGPIPENLKKIGEELQAIENKKNEVIDKFPIYGTLKVHSKFPYTKQFEDCVFNTVEYLLQDGKNASDPGLLLGKIQCGKTNTFENVMALAMDKGIDICIIFTKGTNALSTQTIERFKKDFKFFEPSHDLNQACYLKINEILKLSISEGEINDPKNKFVIICKKEDDNLNALIDLYTNKLPKLKNKKTLIIDDEADFASINYSKHHGELKMGKIPQQIYDFRNTPKYCRYLQVTATPQALFLQPTGEFKLSEGKLVSSFKPRFTTFVPEHKNYIGGRHYYELSEDENSMYSHIYQPVNDKILDIFSHRDSRYINNNIESKNLDDLTKFIISYLVATSIRVLQKEKIEKGYQSSAIIHCEINTKMHAWQEELIKKLIDRIKEMVISKEFYNYEKTITIFNDCYTDFKESNKKAHNQNLVVEELYFPTKSEVKKEFEKILKNKYYDVKIVNSFNNVKDMLDKDGQLELKTTANIFIGGSILDRGITVANLIHFYYGRMPKVMQMDTVLQHARMYGSRTKEDMAVTRFYTTQFIYSNLVEINDFDNMLRSWLENGSKAEDSLAFLEYSSTVKPCSQQKIMPSKTIFVKPNRAIIPKYFDTKKNDEISEYVSKIDEIIKPYPTYEYFEIQADVCKKIIELIDKTFEIEDSMKDQSFDKKSMINCIDYLSKDCSGKLVCKIFSNEREMHRLLKNGDFNGNPIATNTELNPMRDKCVAMPGFILIKQKGGSELGWKGSKNGNPFYWPIIMPQKQQNSFVFTQSVKSNSKEWVDPKIEDLIGNLEKDGAKILKLTLTGDFNKINSLEDFDQETRIIETTTASKYLETDFNHPSGYKIAQGVDADSIDSIFYNKSLPEDYYYLQNMEFYNELHQKQKNGMHLSGLQQFFIDCIDKTDCVFTKYDANTWMKEINKKVDTYLDSDYSNSGDLVEYDIPQEAFDNQDKLNKGELVFPFVLKDYDYILFNNGRDDDGDRLLVKIDKENISFCITNATPDSDQLNKLSGNIKDIILPKHKYVIIYKFEKLIGKILNPTDQKKRQIIFI